MRNATRLAILFSVTSLALFTVRVHAVELGERLRVLVETDIGGDADDQASLIRFLMYSPEWDVEGIIADRPAKTFHTDGVRNHLGLDAENGYELTVAYLKAYKQVYPNLIKHDPRFLSYESLKERTKPGFDDSDEGVNLIIQVLTADDPRPIWFANWGSNSGTTSSMKRALAKLEKQLSREQFNAILQKIRVTRNPEKFLPWSQHVPLSVDTRNPDRWYHSFKPVTSQATGFAENRNIKTGHGPLAEVIADADDHDHLVGAHHQSGTTFKAWQPAGALRHFSMQYNEAGDAAHAGAVEAFQKARGKYQVIYAENTAREGDVKQAWASALGGLMPMLLGLDGETRPPRR